MFTAPDRIRLSDSKQIDSGALVRLYKFGWWSNQRTEADVEKMLEHTSMANQLGMAISWWASPDC